MFTRTKEDNEKERQLIAELRKLDTLIKKTEKDEKQLERLIHNEKQRQQAVQNQENLIQQKMEEQKNKKQQQREQIRLQEMEWDEEKGDGLDVIDVADVNTSMQVDQQNTAQPDNEPTTGAAPSQSANKTT